MKNKINLPGFNAEVSMSQRAASYFTTTVGYHTTGMSRITLALKSIGGGPLGEKCDTFCCGVCSCCSNGDRDCCKDCGANCPKSLAIGGVRVPTRVASTLSLR